MISQMKNVPADVAAFQATGKVYKEDYEKVVIPVVDSIAKQFGKVKFLLVLDTDVSNYSLGAWADDALVGIKHFTNWRKIAIVSNQTAVVKVTDVLGHLIPGETKGFLLAQEGEAIRWISE